MGQPAPALSPVRVCSAVTNCRVRRRRCHPCCTRYCVVIVFCVCVSLSLSRPSPPQPPTPNPHPRFVVLTTSDGIMDHEEARRKHTGGKVLGFFY